MTRAFGAALLLVALACGGEETARPDVLLVTVDTLRRDHVGAYGSEWAGTPTIDALARDGVLFENHHTVVGLTAPAHVTMFTGLYPREHGVKRNGVALPPDLPLLAEELAARGYETGAALGAGVLGSEFGLDRGFGWFDETFDVGDLDRKGRTGAYERTAEDVLDAALGRLASAGDGPLFLWVHLFDPHAPYLRPDTEYPLISDLESAGAVVASPSELHAEKRLTWMRRGYVAEVRYTDEQLGRLLDAWDSHAHPAGDVVLFTADHGEALGEHGYVGHSLYLYQEQLAVPLIVRRRGADGSTVDAGRRVGSITSVVDVPATLFELIDVPRPRTIGGASLLRYLDGADPDPASFAFAERPPLPGALRRLRNEAQDGGADEDWTPQKQQGRLLALREGQAGGGGLSLVALVTPAGKYIHAEDVPDEWFDLAADPGELANRANAPEARRLLSRIEAWSAATQPRYVTQKNGAGSDAMLEALGYAGD